MRAGALVLTPGPLDPSDWWIGQRLTVPGFGLLTPEPGIGRPPYGVSWLASVAGALNATASGPLVLAGRGTAGPLLPALARTQRAAGRPVAGYIFVDATLPRPGSPSHLDLLSAADATGAAAAHTALHKPGGTWPPDAANPRDHAFWTEALPGAPDWPDAPCGYIRTGAAVPGVGPSDFWARSARARGWTVQESPDVGALLAATMDLLLG